MDSSRVFFPLKNKPGSLCSLPSPRPGCPAFLSKEWEPGVPSITGETCAVLGGPFYLSSEWVPLLAMAHGSSKEFNLSRVVLELLEGIILNAKHPHSSTWWKSHVIFKVQWVKLWRENYCIRWSENRIHPSKLGYYDRSVGRAAGASRVGEAPRDQQQWEAFTARRLWKGVIV